MREGAILARLVFRKSTEYATYKVYTSMDVKRERPGKATQTQPWGLPLSSIYLSSRGSSLFHGKHKVMNKGGFLMEENRSQPHTALA